MADPLFGASIIRDLGRDRQHAADLQRALEDLRSRFEAEGIPFALMGALAMRQYGYARHTEDIDILTTREGLDRIHERLVGRGLVPRAQGLRKALRHSACKVDVDLILEGEHAGSDASPLVFPHPASDAFVLRGDVRVPRLEKLIEFKLVSGVWGHRLGDLADVVRLIQANGLEEAFADRLAPELRKKFLELLEESRKERKLEE